MSNLTELNEINLILYKFENYFQDDLGNKYSYEIIMRNITHYGMNQLQRGSRIFQRWGELFHDSLVQWLCSKNNGQRN